MPFLTLPSQSVLMMGLSEHLLCIDNVDDDDDDFLEYDIEYSEYYESVG